MTVSRLTSKHLLAVKVAKSLKTKLAHFSW